MTTILPVPSPSGGDAPESRDALGLSRILARYAGGDDDAFAELYEALAPRLRRFCLRLTREESEADDVFQDALLRFHRARASYVVGAPALPWIFTIARSAFLDRLRYRARHPESPSAMDDSQSGLGATMSRDSSPESNVRGHALRLMIDRQLREMSEKQRSAYVLLREEGLSAAEAASTLGTTVDVVRQRAHRAYEQIRSALRAAGWDGDAP